MESGRCILANAFIDCLITFINKLTLPENTHTQKPEYNRSSLIDVYRDNMQSSNLQILCNLSLKYPRNPVIRYPIIF